jgi:hypothetical protein
MHWRAWSGEISFSWCTRCFSYANYFPVINYVFISSG